MTRIKKCLDCVDAKGCRRNRDSWFFFFVGLIATISIRIVTLLMNFDPLLGKIAWYVGVVGFIIFFGYQFRKYQARIRSIDQHDFIAKLDKHQPLSDDDYKVLSSIVCRLRYSKERLNFFFIFLTSVLALILAVYFDFFRV